jgi:hypothetical protein
MPAHKAISFTLPSVTKISQCEIQTILISKVDVPCRKSAPKQELKIFPKSNRQLKRVYGIGQAQYPTRMEPGHSAACSQRLTGTGALFI